MIKCYSVQLKSLISISDKAFKACGFDGSEDIIPKSQVFGKDFEVRKSDSYWIAAWLLEKKQLQYSSKKWTMFTKDGKNVGRIEFSHHIPEKINKEIIRDDSLIR